MAEMAFHAKFSLLFIPVAFLAKYLLTLVAYGSGAPGGIFAPVLVLGAVLGAGVGGISNLFTGGGAPAIAGFAYVGMGALFTAIARAPITSIIIVFELTGNYGHILPLMLTCVAANLAARSLGGISIYDALLAREGMPALESHVQERLGDVTIGDVMTPGVETIDAGEPLSSVGERFFRFRHGGYPVVENGSLVGLITRHDFARARELQLPPDTPARLVMKRNPVVIGADETLELAWYRLAEQAIGRLIVVSPDNPALIVGIITRSDLLRATRAPDSRILSLEAVYLAKPTVSRAFLGFQRKKWFDEQGGA